MSKFEKGISGNPAGKKPGSINKRTQLAKLLEPHAEAIVNKTIELALDGDAVALRLCVERLIPKLKHEPIGIELPEKITSENIFQIKEEILRAAFDGRIDFDGVEKLQKLLNERIPHHIEIPSLKNLDPIEASRVYTEFMKNN